MKRSRFTEEQIIQILNEAQAGMKVEELCRKHGISNPTYYNWKAKFGGMTISEMAHPDLLLAEDLAYKPSELILQNLKIEDESADYGASEFTIKSRSVKFRVGKITPTKVGQFVTFWKRIGEGPILPYEFTDCFDFLAVSVRAENHFGQFVFPKVVLCEKGIVSYNGKEGKRAMRIYPPWDKADNSQAKKTQAWQLQYFIKFSENIIDVSCMRYLFDIA